MLFDALGIRDDAGLLDGQPFVAYEHAWRGTKRPVDLYFQVVKEMSPDRLRGREGAPVLVFGMPFDPKGRAPIDHAQYAREAADDSASGGLAWQPNHLSDRALRELGTLVRIDAVLERDRLTEAARMLSASDREQARAILRSQQSALQIRLRACLEAAFGLRPDADGCLGATIAAEDMLVSLDTFAPRPPAGASIKGAMDGLLDRMFEHHYPAHPLFDQDLRPALLGRVLTRVQDAEQQPDQRLHVENAQERRDLAGIAVPLRLGSMTQTHLVLADHWAQHFGIMQARAGDVPMTAQRLRAWIDQPKPMGLTEQVRNLVILAFAAQADRTPMRDGTPAAVSLERIDDAVELREQPVPEAAAWEVARKRAIALFGLTPSEVLKGATVARLAADLKREADRLRPVLAALGKALNAHGGALGVQTSAARLVTLHSAQNLLSELVSDPLAIIAALATAPLQTSEPAVARCLGSAADLRDALGAAAWDIILSACGLSDQRRASAEGLRGRLVEALQADELVLPLGPALRGAQAQASRLLAVSVPSPVAPAVSPSSQAAPPPPPDGEVVEEQTVTLAGADAAVVLDELRGRLETMPDAQLTLTWRLTRRLAAATA